MQQYRPSAPDANFDRVARFNAGLLPPGATGKVLEIDEMRAMARFPVDEMKIGAELYAEKINKAKGPIKLVVPLRGWSSLEREGSILLDPEEDRIFIEALKKHLRVPLEIEDVDCNLEDFDTAQALVNSLIKFMKEEKT